MGPAPAFSPVFAKLDWLAYSREVTSRVMKTDPRGHSSYTVSHVTGANNRSRGGCPALASPAILKRGLGKSSSLSKLQPYSLWLPGAVSYFRPKKNLGRILWGKFWGRAQKALRIHKDIHLSHIPWTLVSGSHGKQWQRSACGLSTDSFFALMVSQ